jgi:uncharacterized protein (TIGR02996 family)
MTDRTALLAAIIANPAEDSVRLGMADWLEEHDEPERAEFIRVQIKIARHQWTMGNTPLVGDEYFTVFNQITELRRCERALWVMHGQDFSSSLLRGFAAVGEKLPNGVWSNVSIHGESMAGYCHERGDAGQAKLRWKPTRGFISYIECTAEDFLRVAPALVWHPEMTDECPACNGKTWVREKEEPSGNYHESLCLGCSAAGRIPRPCPESAMPITSVKLTTWPEPWSEWIKDGMVTDRYTDGRAKACKLQRFPGIVFELP